jgi:peptide/nickel transport system ATP-binding protein
VARPAGDAGEGAARLEIRDISASYRGHRVLTGISLRIPAGRTVGVVGESGSGKSTLSRVIAGLHAEMSGTVLLAGEPLTPRAAKRSDAQLRDIQYVFQNPYDSLNPHHDIQTILSRPGRRFDATYRPEELLDLVSLPKSMLRRLPNALSGGERQRVAIARAVAVSPKVLLCDEVTSSLDVSVQASVLRLLKDIQAELGMSMLFVTHNMAVVRHIADDVVVLKGGRIVEAGPVESMFAAPREAYTQALLSDVPDLWRSLAAWSEPDSGQSGRPELEQTA